VIRNPFDRAISVYYWKFRNNHDKPDLNGFVLGLSEKKFPAWHRLTINNQVAVDLVCRYENLQVDLEKVTQKLGLPALALPHAKATLRKDHRHYSRVLNPDSRAHLEKICAPEMDYFGYQWIEQ